MAQVSRLSVRQACVLAVALAAGAALIALALPRTVAALVLLPADGTLRAVQAQESVEGARLDDLIDRAERALAWSQSGRGWTDLALARLVRAGAGAPALEQARAELRRGLALAPANAFAWTRLALVESRLGDPRTAAMALDLALRTAPFEPRLALPRLELGITLWPQLEAPQRARLLTQVRLAWRADPNRLVRLAADQGAVALVRAGLVGTAGARRRFERMLRERG